MKCHYKIKDGQTCGAWAMKDAQYCFNHNPSSVTEKQAAVIKGGATTYERGLIPLEPIDFTDSKPMLWLLADTINRVRKVRSDGSMDVKTANCIGQLARVMLEAQKEITLIERLEKLEQVAKQQGKI